MRFISLMKSMRRERQPILILALVWLVSFHFTSPVRALELSLPIECVVGTSCAIQSFVDHDGSSSARDFQCGSLTYDGHTGTDFRLPDMASQRRGVNVLAAASGKVIGIRNGMADVLFSADSAPTVEGRECGNGVVIDHGEGWQTQYCHMARGSIRLKVGDDVEKGRAIGLVGLSGKTEFPHLHLTVRHNGKVVDPFAFGALPESCGGGTSLWSADTQSSLKYRPRHILNAGFATGAVTMQQIDSGELNKSFPLDTAEAIVAFVRVIGLQSGDSQRLVLKYPSGQIIADSNEKSVDRPKAQVMMFSGRKRPVAGWSADRLIATYSIMNNDQTVLVHDFKFGAK